MRGKNEPGPWFADEGIQEYDEGVDDQETVFQDTTYSQSHQQRKKRSRGKRPKF